MELLLMRAECHKELGDRENVLADTGKALKVNDKNMAALAMRGDAYYSMDEFELAQRHYRQVMALKLLNSGIGLFYADSGLNWPSATAGTGR